MSEATKLRILTQEEANYQVISPELLERKACVTCRWFYTPDYCQIIEQHPDPINIAGVCDRHETEVNVIEPVPVEIVNEEQRASLLPGLWDSLKTRLGLSENDPDLQGGVFKSLGGGFWFASHTNNFKDVVGEILRRKAHERYIMRLNAGLVPMPELWHAHIPGSRHGKALKVWMDEHLVFAVGNYDDTPAGQAARQFYEKAKPGAIQLSHGFNFHRASKKDGVYDDYNTFEISTLLKGYQHPANPYFTQFEDVVTMTISQKDRDSLIQIVGEDAAGVILAEADNLGQRAKKLAELGVAYKDASDLTPEQDTDTTTKTDADPQGLIALVKELMDSQGEVFDFVEAVGKQAEEREQKTVTLIDELQTQLEATKQHNAALKAQLSQRPARVQNAPTTDNGLLDKAKQEIEEQQLDAPSPEEEAEKQFFMHQGGANNGAIS